MINIDNKLNYNFMTKRKFLIDEALQFGWQIMKKNFFFFVGILLFILAIQFIPVVLANFDFASDIVLLVIYLLIMLVSIVIGMGVVKISLNFYDDKKNSFLTLFSAYKLFFIYLLATILYTLIVFLGFILLIIPGVYLAIRFSFFEYFIIDKKMGVIKSLKESWKITKGNFWGLLAFMFIVAVINILGAFALLLGLFVSIPITWIAWAFIYRKLSESRQENIEASKI